MRRIYISFLGAGDYKPAIYHIENKQADRSQYVQFAELQLTGGSYGQTGSIRKNYSKT